jgi:hypothetical protein
MGAGVLLSVMHSLSEVISPFLDCVVMWQLDVVPSFWDTFSCVTYRNDYKLVERNVTMNSTYILCVI